MQVDHPVVSGQPQFHVSRRGDTSNEERSWPGLAVTMTAGLCPSAGPSPNLGAHTGFRRTPRVVGSVRTRPQLKLSKAAAAIVRSVVNLDRIDPVCVAEVNSHPRIILTKGVAKVSACLAIDTVARIVTLSTTAVVRGLRSVHPRQDVEAASWQGFPQR